MQMWILTLKRGIQRNTRQTYVEGQNQRPSPVNHKNDHRRCWWHNDIVDQSWGEGIVSSWPLLSYSLSTLSNVSVSLILTRESRQRAIIVTIKLPMGQGLSSVFMNSDFISGLVYEHMTGEPVVVQKLNEKTPCWPSQKVKTLKIYVIHCDPLRCGWVTV